MKKFKKIVVFGGAACSLALLLFFSVVLVASAQGYIPLAPIEGTLKAGSNTTDLPTYLAGIYKVAIAAAGALAFLMIVWGGFTYVTAESIGGKDAGREYIQNAIGGLVLAIASYVLLYTINPALVQLNLDFGKLAAPSKENVDWGYYAANNAIVNKLRGKETTIAGTMLQQAGFTDQTQRDILVANKQGERGTQIAILNQKIADSTTSASDKNLFQKQKDALELLDDPNFRSGKIFALEQQVTSEQDTTKRADLQKDLNTLRAFNAQIDIAQDTAVAVKSYLIGEGQFGEKDASGTFRTLTMAQQIAKAEALQTSMLRKAREAAEKVRPTDPGLAEQILTDAATANKAIGDQIALRRVCPQDRIYRTNAVVRTYVFVQSLGVIDIEPEQCTLTNHP